jgi:glutamine phosphoribosylpyrophosphate amidotransferase
MCSVIGYQGKFNEQLIKKLMYNSRIRGLHAFGYTYVNDGQLTTYKFLDYNTFVDSIIQVKPELFIAHFRYSTSGDYKVVDNNQPLQQEQVSIAFNGVVSQKTKPEMEQDFNLKLIADNDGYVLLNKYNDNDFLIKKNISFALVGLEGNRLFALRNNNRPLHFYADSETIVVCSTKDILNRSGLLKTTEIAPLQKTYFDD